MVQERVHGRLPSDHWPVLATVVPASRDTGDLTCPGRSEPAAERARSQTTDGCHREGASRIASPFRSRSAKPGARSPTSPNRDQPGPGKWDCKLGIEAALAEIREHAGVKYDAAVVAACVRLVEGQGFQFTP